MGSQDKTKPHAGKQLNHSPSGIWKEEKGLGNWMLRITKEELKNSDIVFLGG